MYKKLFEGWYFKNQNKYNTLSIIPGISASGAFIQVITDKASYNVNFKKEQFNKNNHIQVGNSIFSFNGIDLNIKTDNLVAKGKLFYNSLTPLSSDIMGPFKFFPMICRHGIISMHHEIAGQIDINGENFEFVKGTGYIEKDSGYSFPKRYVWVQSNDFKEKCSIMLAIAELPFCGFKFNGIICSVHYKGKEYRIATYNGGKILKCNSNNIIVCNKNLCINILIDKHNGLNLNAPINGQMSGIIKESPSCSAYFKFFKDNKLIFDLNSTKSSCEFVGY